MATLEDAVQTQARNIEQATGRSVDAWAALPKASGKERHGDILAKRAYVALRRSKQFAPSGRRRAVASRSA